MSTNVSSVTSHFPKPQPGFTTTTSGSVSSGAATVGFNSTGNYSNGDVVALVIDPADVDKKQVLVGTIDTSGVQLTGVVWTDGTNQSHASGATVVDFVTATHIQMMSKGMLVQHKQDGTHANTITTNAINENTLNNGVAIDGLSIKDGKLNTNNSVVTSNITDESVTPAKWTNPYCFRVYRAAALNSAGGETPTKIAFDTKSFDLNGDFDLVNSRYVAEVDGVYTFYGRASTNANTQLIAYLYLNGALYSRGDQNIVNSVAGVNHFDGIEMEAGDYVEFFVGTSSVNAFEAGAPFLYFGGKLESQTG